MASQPVHDVESDQWPIDMPTAVSRNDVLYTTPSKEPWEAMPVGGGDLSAMVRCDGDLHLHLSKSDAWDVASPPGAAPMTRCFNNVSPGHLTIGFGARGAEATALYFRQRLDLYRGRIVITLGSPKGPCIEIWGHPSKPLLVVQVTDPERQLGNPVLSLRQWRKRMTLGQSDNIIFGQQVYGDTIDSYLASSGMQSFFNDATDPMQGRGLAVVVGSPDFANPKLETNERVSRIASTSAPPTRYRILIGCAVTDDGAPLQAARGIYDNTCRVPAERLLEEQQSWWQAYWSQSLLHMESADGTANWLCAAYHVHLYTLGCVNRGRCPAKWDGGAGLMREDDRKWGLGEWIQEIRFTYLPLYAANHLEMARGLTRYYTGMLPYLKEQTKVIWGLSGIWIPETVLPWGQVEDWFMDDVNTDNACVATWAPETARHGRFRAFNLYVGFLFTAGLELCHCYLTEYRYREDEAFLNNDVYPLLRGVCEFICELLELGEDGRYHLDPANALETWWMVQDPQDTFSGIRAIFPEFISLAQHHPNDAACAARCADVLANLPPPATGTWHQDGRIEPDGKTYAPAAAIGDYSETHNAENPALYRLFPFALSGIDAADYDIMLETFNQRIASGGHGWSLDAVWAARLGLGDEAGALLAKHATKFNRYRYGGWDSNDNSDFPNGLAVTPFTDAGGNCAFALNEMHLQSHNGLLRVLPAVPKSWSGQFRLRAERGFLVAAAYENGQARFVRIESISGNDCTVANPWPDGCRVQSGNKLLLTSSERHFAFPTERETTYLLTPAEQPLSTSPPTLNVAPRSEEPGLPGRCW